VLGRTATVAGLACCVGLLTLNVLTGATAEQRTSQPDPRTPARGPAVLTAQPARSPRNANYTITARLEAVDRRTRLHFSTRAHPQPDAQSIHVLTATLAAAISRPGAAPQRLISARLQ